MPTFRAINGHDVWIPACSVLRAEPGEGGLTTRLVMAAPPGSPPGSIGVTEVEGTVRTNGEILEAACIYSRP